MRSHELARGFAEALATDWHSVARHNQLPPAGDWRIWLLLAGRGFGKTRSGAEWVREQAESGAAKRIALVSATASDCRDVLVEGESGILAISPRHNRPVYESSKRRLTWPNGCIATTYSADEAERLRGPQHDAAWADELGAWRYPESWDMLMMGLRLGNNPRCVVTTTPKPLRLIRELVARENKDVVITRGATRENAANLAPQFLQTIVSRYAGTRLGRQELDGELLTDTPGALWSAATLESTRVVSAPALQRIVIGVDPSGGGGPEADEAGIIVAGLGVDGHGYVLADASNRLAPTEWAMCAIDLYRAHRADRIVAEVNFGGAMCTATIAAVDATVPVKTINSSRGKVLRAEPIAALFEQGRCHVVGTLPGLEDQMCGFTSDWDRARDGSPDRVDAAVFALSELMFAQPVGGFFREASLLVDGQPVELPLRPDGIYAVVGSATKVEPEVGVAVVYFGVNQHMEPALVVIDWEVSVFDGGREWLPGVFARLDSWRQTWRVQPAHCGVWILETPIGAALLRQAEAAALPANSVAAEVVATAGDARAIAVARFVGAGDVKVSRAAHEKTTEFRSVTRNHLMAQVLGFGVGAEPQTATELLASFCAGVTLGLDGRSEAG